jgi:hypothetical protein
LGGRDRWVSEFEASLVSLQSEFQDSQGYTEKPCLEKKKKKKKERKRKRIALTCARHYVEGLTWIISFI